MVVEVEAMEVMTKKAVECGLRKCTYYHCENHIVDFCWKLYSKPLVS